MFTTSCSTSWIGTFDTWVAIAAPAAVGVVTAIDEAEGIPINQAALDKINKDAAALKSLGQSIINATGANLPTACADFNAGVALFVADVPTLEQLGSITDPVKLADITLAITLLQVTVASIEVPITACQTAPTPVAARAALVNGMANILTPSEFVTKYNKLNLAKNHKLHINPWYVRYGTFGVKK